MKCKICRDEKTCQTLEYMSDDGDMVRQYVCDDCWDIIAAIAKFQAKHEAHGAISQHEADSHGARNY